MKGAEHLHVLEHTSWSTSGSAARAQGLAVRHGIWELAQVVDFVKVFTKEVCSEELALEAEVEVLRQDPHFQDV